VIKVFNRKVRKGLRKGREDFRTQDISIGNPLGQKGIKFWSRKLPEPVAVLA